jgi:hypothetical protein
MKHFRPSEANEAVAPPQQHVSYPVLASRYIRWNARDRPSVLVEERHGKPVLNLERQVPIDNTGTHWRCVKSFAFNFTLFPELALACSSLLDELRGSSSDESKGLETKAHVRIAEGSP